MFICLYAFVCIYHNFISANVRIPKFKFWDAGKITFFMAIDVSTMSGGLKNDHALAIPNCDNNLLSCVHSLLVDLPEMGVFHLKSA